jgi:MOSC domain-containing protein YiiM
MLREVPIVSVNAGAIALLGQRRGRPVHSGIVKAPVLGGTDLHLGPEGLLDPLDGHRVDFQADERVIRGKRVHGGPLKAVYAYPRAHYAPWANELNCALIPGGFGENLTVDDILEDEVVIGERWAWGDAILEVTGPRRPCYKLNMLRGDGTSEAMMANGRCGWYFRVIQTGKVPTVGALQVIDRPATGLTIADAFRRKAQDDPTVPDMPDD